MTSNNYPQCRKVRGIRARASALRWNGGLKVLIFFCFATFCARFGSPAHQSAVVMGGRLPKYLHCPSARHLTSGTWIVEQKNKFTWWEPLDCFLSTYGAGSIRQLLAAAKPVFVSTSGKLDILEEICELGEMSCRDEASNLSHVSLSTTLKYPDLLRDAIKRTSATVLLIFDAEETGQLCTLISSHRADGFKGKVFSVSLSSTATDVYNDAACFKSENSGGLEVVDFGELFQKHAQASKSLCLQKSNGIKTRKIAQNVAYESDRDCYDILAKQLRVVIAQILLNAIGMYSTQTQGKFGVHHSGSCAVVSSAGYLLKANLGYEIDSADFVIRTSIAPRKGFEDFVGSRTDLRILRNSAFDSERGNYEPEGEENIIVVHDRVPNTTSPMWKFSNHLILAEQSAPYINFRRPTHTGNFQYSTLGRCLAGSRDISTGMWAISLLYHQNFCREIKLYGFLGHKHLDEPYHYFAVHSHEEWQHSTRMHYESRKRKKGGHDFIREQKCMEDMLARRDKIVSIV